MSRYNSNKNLCRRTPAVDFRSTGWASLPVLVFFILDKLLEPIDHVRFAAVCKEWRSMSKLYNQATQRWCNKQLPPMLLIPNHDSDDRGRVLYSISEGIIYKNIELQVPFSKRCCGFSHGWLATVDPTTDQGLIIALSNPFTKAKPILLPPLIGRVREYESSYYEHYVRKVILSTDPALNPENYVVVALYFSWFRLVFIKAGQSSWTYLKDGCFYGDVIFYKNQVYAVRQLGAIWSFDVHSSDIKNSSQLKLRTPPEPFQDYGFHAYLVESTEGDLLHILRHYELKDGLFNRNNRRTTGFEVYKWVLDDEDGSSGHKVELKSIGDQALFLGDNDSISVLASKFPGCQPNSIYYTDDYISGYPLFDGDQAYDMGIFSLEDRTITQPYPLHTNSQRAVCVVPPFHGLC